MTADSLAAVVLGVTVGGAAGHYLTWRFARKVESLVAGRAPLARWDAHEGAILEPGAGGGAGRAAAGPWGLAGSER